MRDAPELVSKDFQRTTLKARHRPVVRALTETLLCPDGEPTPGRLDEFVSDVDRFMSSPSKTLRLGLLLMLDVIRWSPVIFGRLSTFEKLTPSERLRHVERLETSRLQRLPMILTAYRVILTMLFYEHPDELVAMGYPGPERHRYKRGLPMVGVV